MSIILSHINKRFGDQVVLSDLNLSISKGEIVAFLGPNGAGKSTTMKIMAGLLCADSGSVTVCGHDVETQPMEVRRKIGYLPENNPLYLDMYVREYLEFVAGFYKMEKRASNRISDLIKQLGLSGDVHKKIGQLSKGYRQRVGLAQALIHDPEVLILDEPTTGLDPNQLIDIRQFIQELANEKTVILSTHILQEAAAICDRTLIIHKGSIVADSITAELKLNLASESFEVEFNSNIEINVLLTLPGLSSATQIAERTYRVQAETDIRESLFYFCVKQGWVILALSRSEKSLEDVFGMFTK